MPSASRAWAVGGVRQGAGERGFGAQAAGAWLVGDVWLAAERGERGRGCCLRRSRPDGGGRRPRRRTAASEAWPSQAAERRVRGSAIAGLAVAGRGPCPGRSAPGGRAGWRCGCRQPRRRAGCMHRPHLQAWKDAVMLPPKKGALVDVENVVEIAAKSGGRARGRHRRRKITWCRWGEGDPALPRLVPVSPTARLQKRACSSDARASGAGRAQRHRRPAAGAGCGRLRRSRIWRRGSECGRSGRR